MKYALEYGRPDDAEDRLEKEIKCYDLLDELGLKYWRVDHTEADADSMEDLKKINLILDAEICKNLLLCNRQHTQFYLLMMPGDKVFKTKELSGQLGCSRLSFAESEWMTGLLDITPGSLSVLGLMNDRENRVQLIVDEDILKNEFTGLHPCINTSSLKLYTEDIFGPVIRAMHHDMITVKLVGETEGQEG